MYILLALAILVIAAAGQQKLQQQATIEGNDFVISALSYIGVYDWSWDGLGGADPVNANLLVAFSGWGDVDAALSESAAVQSTLPKYLSIGGGNAAGIITAASLTKLNSAIAAGRLSAYTGICYDVEEGEQGMALAFGVSFATAKLHGLKVLVTVSHSAPYGFPDKAALMGSFFASSDIDILSPQLYTTGTETVNDWSWDGVPFSAWSTAKAAVVPSIVKSTLYPEAEATFLTSHGVTTSGFLQWSQSASSAPATTASPTASPTASTPVLTSKPTAKPTAKPSPSVPTAKPSFPIVQTAKPSTKSVGCDYTPMYAINTGAAKSAYTASNGQVYQVDDQYHSEGKTYSTASSIAGTLDDTLYRTERWTTGGALSYAFPVKVGSRCRVTIKMAEIYFSAAGKRVFDIKVEGVKIAANVDLFALVGKNAAYDVVHTVTATDDFLNVDLIKVMQNPKVNAIVIEKLTCQGVQQRLYLRG